MWRETPAGTPRRPGSILVLALAMSLLSSTATAGESRRSGFTAEVDIGVGLTQLFGDSFVDGFRSSESTQWGWGGLAVGVGGFVNERTAMLLRISGTSFQTPRLTAVGVDSSRTVFYVTETRDVANAFLGVTVQRWVTPRFAWGAGAGLAAYGTSGNVTRGIAFEGRSAYAIVHTPGWGLRATLECIPAVYDFGVVVSYAALVGFQWY